LAAALDEVTDPNRAELGPGQPGPAGIGVDLVQLGLGELKHLRSRARRLRPPSPNGPPPYPQQPPLIVKKPRDLLVGTLAATLGVMAGCTFGLAISDDGATSSTAAASPTAQRTATTVSERQWAKVIKDPDAHAGERYIILGEVQTV
jgi:hypothetical protein